MTDGRAASSVRQARARRSWGGTASCFPESEHLWSRDAGRAPRGVQKSRLPQMEIGVAPAGAPAWNRCPFENLEPKSPAVLLSVISPEAGVPGMHLKQASKSWSERRRHSLWGLTAFGAFFLDFHP